MKPEISAKSSVENTISLTRTYDSSTSASTVTRLMLRPLFAEVLRHSGYACDISTATFCGNNIKMKLNKLHKSHR